MLKTNCTHPDVVDVPEMDPTCRGCFYHWESMEDRLYYCGYNSYQENLAHSEPTDEYHLVPWNTSEDLYDGEYSDDVPF